MMKEMENETMISLKWERMKLKAFEMEFWCERFLEEELKVFLKVLESEMNFLMVILLMSVFQSMLLMVSESLLMMDCLLLTLLTIVRQMESEMKSLFVSLSVFELELKMRSGFVSECWKERKKESDFVMWRQKLRE